VCHGSWLPNNLQTIGLAAFHLGVLPEELVLPIQTPSLPLYLRFHHHPPHGGDMPLKPSLATLSAITLSLFVYSLNETVAVAAPPTPTVSTDHSGVTPNWDKVLPPDTRFVIIPGFNNEAVRDNETGLVWEKTPTRIATGYEGAIRACQSIQTGGRMGWRLPTYPELVSLVQTTNTSFGSLSLPTGHPFSVSTSAVYFTLGTTTQGTQGSEFFAVIAVNLTPTAVGPSSVIFPVGGVLTSKFDQSVSNGAVWCVRSGHPVVTE
jgi:hypothetical protein